MDESWHDQADSPENGEMASSTSVERSHAIKSSIENLMRRTNITFLKSSSRSTKRKWTDIPSSGIVERKSLEWSLFWYDIVTLLIEKLTKQFIGVLRVPSDAVSSNVKVREPSLNLSGWVISTGDAANPGFSVA